RIYTVPLHDALPICMWRNWAGDQHCAPVESVEARSREDVVAVVERAAQGERTVRPRGAGHSFTDIALTNGHHVSLAPMGAVLDRSEEHTSELQSQSK